MKVFTAHIHARKAPVLVREAFSWGGFLFGPLWLLRHGAWIATIVSLAVLVLICTALPAGLRPALALGEFLLLGAIGNDLRRWSLARAQYELAHVIAARTGDDAYYRLLRVRPDQVRLA